MPLLSSLLPGAVLGSQAAHMQQLPPVLHCQPSSERAEKNDAARLKCAVPSTLPSTWSTIYREGRGIRECTRGHSELSGGQWKKCPGSTGCPVVSPYRCHIPAPTTPASLLPQNSLTAPCQGLPPSWLQQTSVLSCTQLTEAAAASPRSVL